MEKKTFESLKTFSANSFVRKRIWQSDKLHCNIYCFEPGQQNSLHLHPVSDEVVFCLEGDWIVVVGTENQSIKAGETVLVPMNTPPWVHQYEPRPPHDHQCGSMSTPSRTCTGRAQ